MINDLGISRGGGNNNRQGFNTGTRMPADDGLVHLASTTTPFKLLCGAGYYSNKKVTEQNNWDHQGVQLISAVPDEVNCGTCIAIIKQQTRN